MEGFATTRVGAGPSDAAGNERRRARKQKEVGKHQAVIDEAASSVSSADEATRVKGLAALWNLARVAENKVPMWQHDKVRVSGECTVASVSRPSAP